MAGGEPRGWRAVALEMLSQSGVGSQVSPHFAWSRACKEILSLRTENARLTRELGEASEALNKFGLHGRRTGKGCPAPGPGSGDESLCTCGLTEARAAASAKGGGGEDGA